IDVGVGDGRIRRAWTYFINDPHCNALSIPSGNWRQRQRQHDAFINRLVTAYCAGDEKRLARLMAKSKSFEPTDSSSEENKGFLADAMRDGTISERQLAQATQKWVVIPS
ncbi:MAG: hypothetical protein AB7F94_15610, partial [Nitrospira sp.]